MGSPILQLVVAFVIIGPVVFIALWPWLWYDTLQRLQEYLLFQFQHYPVTTYYFGTIYERAPWHYPLVMTLITMPPLTLLMVLVGAVRIGREAWRQSFPSTLLAVGIIVNLLVASLPSTPKYNGVRLFMPVFPLLGIAAGVGFGQILRVVSGRWSVIRRERKDAAGRVGLLAGARSRTVVLGILLLGPAARAVAVTHPYQMSYYSVLVGGMRGAVARGLPATYWGDTFLGGWDFLCTRAPWSRTVWVAPPGCRSILDTYRNMGRRPDLYVVSPPSPPPSADFAIFQNKPNEYNEGCRALLRAMEGGQRPVHVVERCGVPLLFVFGPSAIRAVQAESAGYEQAPEEHQ